MEIPSNPLLVLQALMHHYSLTAIARASKLSLKTLYRILANERISGKSDFALTLLYCQWQLFSTI